MPTLVDRKTIIDAEVFLLDFAREQRRLREAEPQAKHTIVEKPDCSLAEFIAGAWPILEPATGYQHNWHLEVLTSHLEAISRGELQDLLVNIPPGFMKSLTVSVFWPAWEWTWLPWTRWLFVSYAEQLAIRDTLKMRRLIESEWYQDRWRDRFKLTSDQNQKTRFENNRTGFRIASSVAGLATGEHVHRRVCLKYNTPIVTDIGDLPIGRIVERRLPVRVLAFDHATGRRRWRPITAYESSPGRACVRVRLSTGATLEGTDDHPVYVEGVGYVGLAALLPGQALVANGTPVRHLWCRRAASASPSRSVYRGILRSRLPASRIARAPSASEAQGDVRLRAVRQDVWRAAVSAQAGAGALLLTGLQRRGEVGAGRAALRPMRRVWRPDSDQAGAHRQAQLLLEAVREPGAPGVRAREDERPLRRWFDPDAVPARFPQERQTVNQAARRLGVRRLWSRAEVPAGAPHRRRQDQSRPDEPRQSVHCLPSQGALEGRPRSSMDGPARVVAVERIATPDAVYNVRVAEDHNYFAAGVLVHNCDDPHKVKEAESDPEREGVVTAWKETMTSRGIATSPLNARVMVMQRVHEQDVAADWLEREPQVHHICLANEYETPRGGDRPDAAPTGLHVHSVQSPSGSVTSACSIVPHEVRHTDGELLWPAMVDQAETDALKTTKLGPYAYAGQYQQRPTPRAGMVLDPAQIGDLPHLQAATVDIIMAWDLNYSSKDASDWTVGMVAAVDKDPVLPRLHIIDVFRHHLTSEQHDQVIADWIATWRPILVGIERRAYEHQGATQDLIRRVMVRLEQAHVLTTLEPIEADTDKLSRAMIIPGRAKAGLITANKRAPWWGDLSRELSSFPRGAHDDQVDALAYLVRLAVEKLSMVRNQQMLLGHSARLQYVQAEQPAALEAGWAGLVGSAR